MSSISKSRVAIHCPTQELWNRVFKKIGKKSYGDRWAENKEESCQVVNGYGGFYTKEVYDRLGYEIISAEDYLGITLKEEPKMIGRILRNILTKVFGIYALTKKEYTDFKDVTEYRVTEYNDRARTVAYHNIPVIRIVEALNNRLGLKPVINADGEPELVDDINTGSSTTALGTKPYKPKLIFRDEFEELKEAIYKEVKFVSNGIQGTDTISILSLVDILYDKLGFTAYKESVVKSEVKIVKKPISKKKPVSKKKRG